ncbi:MAG: response regulator [Brumimicrobium sp.]
MKNYNILLVEDNEGDVLLTKEAFEESGFKNNLAIVNDGQEAINYLERISPFLEVDLPDIILLDINLPKLNGHEVLKYIKTNNNYKHIPVIMLTTSSSDVDVSACYANYANCYITKPTDVTDFFNVINELNRFWLKTARLTK